MSRWNSCNRILGTRPGLALVLGLLLGLVLLVPSSSAPPPSAPAQAQVGARAGAEAPPLQGLALTPAALPDLEELGPIPQYELRLNLNPQQLDLFGWERLSYTNTTSSPLGELYLRLYPNGGGPFGRGELALTGAAIVVSDDEGEGGGGGNEDELGRPLQPELLLDGSIARLPLEEPLLPGGSLTVELEWTAEIPREFASRGGPSYGIFNYSQGVFTLADGYPLLAVHDEEEGWQLDPVYSWGDAVFSSVGFYEAWITVPQDQIVIASGSELNRVSNPDGTVTYHYVSGPMRDFFFSVSSRFRRLTTWVGETQVNSYYLEGDELGGQAALAVAARALRLFSERFGPYPYAELDVIETPLPWVGGVEYPGVVLISERLYGPPEYLAREELLFAMIVSHEVAHQWWYGLVGNDVIEEPWLDEALATYSSGLYIEEFLGEEAFAELLESWWVEFERARAQLEVPVTAPLSEFPGGRGYYGIVYCGGALFYHELRAQLGDELFFAALREYLQRFKYKIATTQELLDLLEEVAGRELDELYERWLLTPARSF